MMNIPNKDHLKITKNNQHHHQDNNMENNLQMTTILRGIQLAKDLEPNLAHNLATNREYIAQACENIVRVFSSVRERVICEPLPPPLLGGVSSGDVVDHSWSRTTQDHHHPRPFHSPMVARAPPAFSVQPVEPMMRLHRPGSGEQAHHLAAAQRPRRSRRDELERYTKIVPAPQMGNVDIPPEDGYTWRKYGQKEILGSRFPRAYYRCTHQKLYKCPAKKQVQRLGDNPFMFQVTYRSNHICHMSATAPSSEPPSTSGGGAVTGNWLTMDIKPQPAGGDDLEFCGHHAAVSVSSTSNVAAVAGGDYGGQPVVDLVDVMFNYSGSSSNNSMDLIFPSTDQRGDNISGEKN